MIKLKILRISKEVMNSFKTVSEQRGEHIPGESLLTIATFFLVLYEILLFYILTIVTVQPPVGGKPHKTLVVLTNVVHSIVT